MAKSKKKKKGGSKKLKKSKFAKWLQEHKFDKERGK